MNRFRLLPLAGSIDLIPPSFSPPTMSASDLTPENNKRYQEKEYWARLFTVSCLLLLRSGSRTSDILSLGLHYLVSQSSSHISRAPALRRDSETMAITIGSRATQSFGTYSMRSYQIAMLVS